MSPCPIHAVIFDIGMVLLKFDFDLSIEKLKDRCKAKPEEIAMLLWESGIVDAYDRGKISTEQFIQKASALIGFYGTPQEIMDAWSDIFIPNLPMIERAKRWKQERMPLYFLSNTCELHIEYFTKKYDFFGIFNGGAYSCREGYLKPEEAIYRILLKRYRLKSKTTLFIDDRLENVFVAQKLGIQAIHYENEARLHKALIPFGLK